MNKIFYLSCYIVCKDKGLATYIGKWSEGNFRTFIGQYDRANMVVSTNYENID